MCNLVPCGFHDAAGVRAIADHDYYHPEFAGEHHQNHNGKEHYLLSAGTERQRRKRFLLYTEYSRHSSIRARPHDRLGWQSTEGRLERNEAGSTLGNQRNWSSVRYLRWRLWHHHQGNHHYLCAGCAAGTSSRTGPGRSSCSCAPNHYHQYLQRSDEQFIHLVTGHRN
jgi:hypothetical protein